MNNRVAIIFFITLTAAANAVAGGLKLGDICRVKGQEVNTLQGLGLVVGLRGTGDSDAAPTARALARMMQLMGGQVALDSAGALNLRDIKDAKNVALVFVTVKVPAVGAQQGDLLDVSVNAISAKSLDGGYLMLTPLLGPRADNPKVFALAQGALSVSMDGPPTNARIQGGCKVLDSLIPIGQQPPEGNASLKALADALNALDVSTDDLIAIIKTLKKKGDLYGEVVFE